MKKAIILSFMFIVLASAAVAQSIQEKNKTIVKSLLLAQTVCDLNVVAEVVDKNVKGYLFGKQYFDYDELINIWKEKKGPGQKVEFEDLVAEGNKVVVKWIYYHNTGMYKGLSLAIIENGKIIEWHSYHKKMGETINMHPQNP